MKRESTKSLAIERIVKEYTSANYDVVIQPEPNLLPSQLRRFQPDILARKGNKHVLIEVKSRNEFAAETEMSALAKEIEKLKGWQLEVQFIGPARQLQEQPVAPLSLKQASERLDSVSLLLSHDDPESALVIAWSVFEAVLRQLSWNADVPVIPWNALRAAKQLVTLGILSRSEYELFMSGSNTRNQVVHGGSVTRSVEPMVHSIVSTVRRLIKQSEMRSPAH